MLETSRIVRRITRQVRIGGGRGGGDSPIVVQSMTNTDTTDSAATAEQVIQLAGAGSVFLSTPCPIRFHKPNAVFLY